MRTYFKFVLVYIIFVLLVAGLLELLQFQDRNPEPEVVSDIIFAVIGFALAFQIADLMNVFYPEYVMQ